MVVYVDIDKKPFLVKLKTMTKSTQVPIHSAFVLGSTSEVAKAICHELARRGCMRFHLVARNEEANQQLASQLQGRYGAAVSTEQTDLLEDASLGSSRLPQVGEFDLYLITAGSLGDAELARNDSAEALRILAANVTGSTYCLRSSACSCSSFWRARTASPQVA